MYGYTFFYANVPGIVIGTVIHRRESANGKRENVNSSRFLKFIYNLAPPEIIAVYSRLSRDRLPFNFHVSRLPFHALKLLYVNMNTSYCIDN